MPGTLPTSGPLHLLFPLLGLLFPQMSLHGGPPEALFLGTLVPPALSVLGEHQLATQEVGTPVIFTDTVVSVSTWKCDSLPERDVIQYPFCLISYSSQSAPLQHLLNFQDRKSVV